MKLALEALGLYARTLAPTETQKKGVEATTALREALAEQQQEPVAWMHTNAIGHVYFRKNPQDKTLNPVPLYTRKPLTDEEIRAIVRKVDEEEGHIIHFARAIKAAHGIKENP